MRNTDLDWIKIGEGEPYYGVLTHERFLRKNLTDEALLEFWQSGKDFIERAYFNLQHCFGTLKPKIALDFGCGVGRLVHGMSKFAEQVYGVDISEPMLREARRFSKSNIHFTSELPDIVFNWINSYIVFQHIPPERGYIIFQNLLDRLAPNGVISVHFTLFKSLQGIVEHGISGMDISTWDGKKLKTLIQKEPGDGSMMMFDYDLTLIMAMLVKSGVSKIFIEHTNHGGCHGAYICKTRDLIKIRSSMIKFN